MMLRRTRVTLLLVLAAMVGLVLAIPVLPGLRHATEAASAESAPAAEVVDSAESAPVLPPVVPVAGAPEVAGSRRLPAQLAAAGDGSRPQRLEALHDTAPGALDLHSAEPRHVGSATVDPAAPTAVVTVDTTSLVIDGDVSSVGALLADVGDDGAISFPEALSAVNNTGAGHTINFALVAGSVINWSSQFTYGLFAANTTIDGTIGGVPGIVLIGPAGFHSLAVYSSGNVLRGLVITGLSFYGAGSNNNLLANSYIGPNITGNASNNQGLNGIEIETGAHSNTIGGTVVGDRNVVSGNTGRVGVFILDNATGNTVVGNYIGIGAAGAALPNSYGVVTNLGATNNVVGGDRPNVTCDGPCNVISGNSLQGVQIESVGTTGNRVEGNYIGVNSAGSAALPNANVGIFVALGANANTIGGERVGESCRGVCNVISGNGAANIVVTDAGTDANVIAGNYIGPNSGGTAALSGSIVGLQLQLDVADSVIGGARSGVSTACSGPCNVISGNYWGIALISAGTNNNRVEGNFIGTRPAGTAALPNFDGILVGLDASENTIGGDRGSSQECTGVCNLLSGNTNSGIQFASFGGPARENTVTGNFIGTGPGGTTAVANLAGVVVGDGAADNVFGAKRSDAAVCDATCNVIGGNSFGQVYLVGPATTGNQFLGNRIGYDRSGIVPLPNNSTVYGVLADAQSDQTVVGSTRDSVVAGTHDGEGNEIFNGVVVFGSADVTVLNNDMRMHADRAQGSAMVIDLDADGASCNAWQPAGGTNNGVAPPRLLDLTAGALEGMTQPNYVVEAYRVREAGTGRGRYFAGSIRPIGHAVADAAGRFTLAVDPGDLSVDDQVTLTATDLTGSTSETSQLLRPVILLHGIGGARLEAGDGDDLWLPPRISSNTVNNRLARLGLNPDGSDIEPTGVVRGTLLEKVLGIFPVYSGMADALEEVGYVDAAGNVCHDGVGGGTVFTTDNDIYRFCYDWRRDVTGFVGELQTLVSDITSGSPSVAAACEVDIYAHSNGTLLSSLYVRTQPAHSQDHVNRFIMSGGPILGTPKAALAHTRGYVFDLDSSPAYWGIDFNSAILVTMTQNMPVAYGLLPSARYFEAANISSYLIDVSGQALNGYAATSQFLTRPFGPLSGPYGLARNGQVLAAQEAVHAAIDDWSQWDGPPYIFRIVGSDVGTAVSFDYDPRLPNRNAAQNDALITVPGDTALHAIYRSAIVPVNDTGDGTVALASASLGHLTGGTDFSGIGRNWVADIITYPGVEHVPLAQGVPMARAADIFRAGHTVPTGSPIPLAGSAETRTTGRDQFYVFTTNAVEVHVYDSLGNHTGPMTPTLTTSIEYGVPGISYQANVLGASLSLPSTDSYTLTVKAAVGETTIQVMRLIDDGSASKRHLVFADETVALDGSVRMLLTNGGTPETTPLDIDSDGDGLYETASDAAIALDSSALGPIIPDPYPANALVTTFFTDTQDASYVLTFPDAGGAVWDWSLTTGTAWLTPSLSAGQTPQGVTVTLGSAAFPVGLYTGTLTATLSYAGYSVDYPLQVVLDVTQPPRIVSQRIQMGYELLNPDELAARVRVQAPDVPEFIAGAVVSATFDLPDGVVTVESLTNSRGWAIFRVPTVGGGNCTLTVNAVAHPDYVFDPLGSRLTRTVPCP